MLWVVLRNERILRDNRNLINVVFVLAFLCLLAVYILLLCCMSSLLLLSVNQIDYLSNVNFQELRVETHRVRTHFKPPCDYDLIIKTIHNNTPSHGIGASLNVVMTLKN